MRMSYNPKLINENGLFRLVDSQDRILKKRNVIRLLERYHSYFENFNELVLSTDLSYVQLIDFIQKLNNKMDCFLDVDETIQLFITESEYAIVEQRIAGITIKDYDDRWNDELSNFKAIIDEEISRPLKPQQVQASFYFGKMKRAANFSVPGAGKTAMTYGAFAYLSSTKVNEADKLLVISPINAFEAWKTEFVEVFGGKRKLHYMNLKDFDNPGDTRIGWGAANVIVINYESLSGWRLSVLNELIDENTMIVFDEVHRVKNPIGERAKNALELGMQSRYHFVLTGTPIPNSYEDIYNFLHLLYRNEYDSFFGWSISDLKYANPTEINKKLQPFFWRTNKKDLKIPAADPDNIIGAIPSIEQEKLAEAIHEIESNVLGRYIRLLQASTNPELLTEEFDIRDLGLLFDEVDYTVSSALDDEEIKRAKRKTYLDLGVSNMRTPKFDKGIELIRKLVSEGKKVIVWGMFVGTMKKIHRELNQSGIYANLVYGQTAKEDRVNLINDFRDGNIPILISNPATLGESISLHQTVHDAVYFEYNFNLTFMLQSRDRIHRLGLPDNQYTRYYYLMSEGSKSHRGFIDRLVYERLKEKETVMMQAIDGENLLPEITDDYLEDVKKIIST